MDRKDKKKIVELVKSDYQPTKAELEEESTLYVPGKILNERMKYLAMGLLQPAKLRRIARPPKRR